MGFSSSTERGGLRLLPGYDKCQEKDIIIHERGSNYSELDNLCVILSDRNGFST